MKSRSRLPGTAFLLAAAVLLAACGSGGTPQTATDSTPPAKLRYELSIDGAAGGTVVSMPAGIDCGSRCSADYDQGTPLRLQARPDAGYRFGGWTGDCGGSDDCLLVMDTGHRVHASFARLPPPPPGQFALSVTRQGDGSGTVVSSPAGIDCGATCTAHYTEGTQVALTATADAGSQFAGWGSDCSGDGACTVTLDASRSVTARFSLIPPPPAPVGLWLNGDTHVHDDHSSDGSAIRQGFNQQGPGNVAVSDQIGQGVLSGLAWMPLTDHRTYDQHYDPLWESASLLLIPGEEANSSPHSTVEGAVDWIVQGASRPGAPDFDRLQTSIWDAHAQGASWSIAHPDDGELNADLTPNQRANAIGMNTMETWNRGSGVEKEIDYAENRWNHGWHFGMVGGSDDHFRELWAIAGPGMPATGVFAAAYNERAIVQGLQAGRTRVALDPDAIAPHVTLEADFQGDGVYEAICGDEVVAPAGTRGTLRIRVDHALGTTIHLYKSPGRSAGDFKSFSADADSVEYRVNVAVEEQPGWYRVEVRGPGQVEGIDTNAVKGADPAALITANTGSNELRAVCSPIFVSTAPVSPAAEIALPADQGTDDGAELALGATGEFSGFPDIAVADGIKHIVAERHGPGATRVVYRAVRADGTMTAETDLAPASKAARFPRIAARGAEVWVAWQDERDGQKPRRPAIYLRHSADGGKTWSAEQKLRGLAGRAEHPALALAADGHPVVAWQEISAGNPFDIMAQVVGSDAAPVNVSRAGKTITAANAYDTRSARYPASVWPSVAVAADGRIAIAFQDNRSDPDPLWTGQMITGDSTDVDNWQVMAAVRPAGAAAWGAPMELGAADRADRHPAVAFAADGALIAAWDSVCLNGAGCNVVVLSARSGDGGATWSTPLAIAADPVGMGQYPRLGRDASGMVRAVWYDSRSADWRWRVMTAVHDALGNWMAVEILPGRGVNTWPATDGSAIVFASTRNAARLQRDRSQQIFWRPVH